MTWQMRQLVACMLLIAALALAAIAVPRAVVAQDTPVSALDFHDAMRKLWEDHITWTRVYIISVAGDLGDRDAVAQRLLDNQTAIGDAIKPFYGDDAGNQLSELLRQHILGAVDILDAAKAGNTDTMNAAVVSWQANADAIATFLNGANPDHWPLDTLQAEMRSHLDLTLQEAQARLGGDFAADIAAYDRVHDQILVMADMLSSGIINQFPDRFAPAALPGAMGDMETMATTEAQVELMAGAVCIVTSAGGNVNLREGPSTDSASIGALVASDAAQVTGQTTGEDGMIWWQTSTGAWVRSDVVSAQQGDCSTAPTVES